MSLTLAAAETIRGVASAATAITYTIMGDEKGASNEFKVLVQGQLPSSIGTLYTVPVGEAAIVKAIHLANTTGSAATAQLNVNGTASANVILPPTTILAGGFATYDGRWTFYNDQGQALGIGAQGDPGDPGVPGVGVPAGGTAMQRLAKIDATDYNTEWVSPGAATIDAQEGGASVVAAASALNFAAADFNITDQTGGVAGVALAAPAGGGSAAAGLVPWVMPHGATLVAGAGDASVPNSMSRMPIYLPGPMKLRSCGVDVRTVGSGTHNWALVDASGDATNPTVLAEGSSALNGGNQWNYVAASGAPVDIDPGAYILLFYFPASNAASVQYTNSVNVTGKRWMKRKGSFGAWDSSPDLTSGWTAEDTYWHLRLMGDMDGSGNQW